MSQRERGFVIEKELFVITLASDPQDLLHRICGG